LIVNLDRINRPGPRRTLTIRGQKAERPWAALSAFRASPALGGSRHALGAIGEDIRWFVHTANEGSDGAAQAEVAARVVAEGLSRAETVEAVRRASGAKGKGRGARAKKVTARVLKTLAGRVTVENRKGLDDALVVAALEDALAQEKGRADPGQAAA
jgi:hypothetical protein